VTRRLAAVLAADVVGYSSLMNEDETGTLAALRAHRTDVFDPIIAERGGRLVKLMGDGALVEFPSVVQAVEAALAIQRETAKSGGAIRLRIGINLGDVMLDGDDIYGDGVNVAARLEGLAKTGGICISAIVKESIGTRLGAGFADAGEHEVKGLPRPIRVWHWPSEGVLEATTKLAVRSGKPVIAVLPFTNISGDADQDHFADGITEDLIAALGRCRWLLVIARNSSFAYKGKSTDIRRTAEELGARYVLEGGVRRSGNRIRVMAQLIDGRDGTRLWGERYDRELGDIFAVQDEIAAMIAGTIEPELEAIERTVVSGRANVDLNAWECYQRGLGHLYKFTLQELEKAKALFQSAVDLDPNFSQAYARLAYLQIQFGWYGPREGRAARAREATAFAKRAVEIDNRDPSARLSLGRALFLSGEMEDGIEELSTAVALDPSFAQAHFALAQALTGIDRHDEALREIDMAIQLSPRDPHLWTFLHIRAIAHYIANDLKQVERDEHAALRQPNVTFYPYTILVAALGRAGKTAEARAAVAALRRLRPGFTCAEAIDEWHFGNHALVTRRFLDQYEADIRSAGLPD
jgi:TolB-like protein/class 3 adenylate cyclase